jgi:hypothetical protein
MGMFEGFLLGLPAPQPGLLRDLQHTQVLRAGVALQQSPRVRGGGLLSSASVQGKKESDQARGGGVLAILMVVGALGDAAADLSGNDPYATGEGSLGLKGLCHEDAF